MIELSRSERCPAVWWLAPRPLPVSPWKYSPRRPRSPKFSTGSETLRLAVDLYKVKDSAAVSLTCLLPAFDSLDQKSRHLPA